MISSRILEFACADTIDFSRCHSEEVHALTNWERNMPTWLYVSVDVGPELGVSLPDPLLLESSFVGLVFTIELSRVVYPDRFTWPSLLKANFVCV